MKSYLLIMLRVGVFCLVGSYLTAALLTAQTDPAVPNEFGMIAFWTLPFVVGTVVVSPLLIILAFSRLPRLVTYPLAILLGVVGGFVWTWILYTMFINPYFGTFSTPVIFVWMAGGVSGLVALAGAGSRARKGNLPLEVVLVILFSLGIGWSSKPFVTQVFEQREVSIVWIRWYPGPEALVLEPDWGKALLTQDERARLQAMNLGGRLEVQGGGPPIQQFPVPLSRMVIIMQQPVKKPVELRVPAWDERENMKGVIYLQQADGTWHMEPPDAPLLRRTLRLAPDPAFPYVTSTFWEYPGGGTSSTGGINWTGQPLP